MLSKKILFSVICSCVLLGGIDLQARKKVKRAKILCKNDSTCSYMQDVKNSPTGKDEKGCQCYCAVECGPRAKKMDDRPVFDETDEYGKRCYCKQWDYDEYENRCLNNPDSK